MIKQNAGNEKKKYLSDPAFMDSNRFSI